MARAKGSLAKVAMAFESVYGTAPVSGFVNIPFANQSLSAAQPLLESELLGNGRDPFAQVKDAVTVDGSLTVPLDVAGIGYWLKAVFGAPTTTGTTPKIHTFESGLAALPSMSIEVATPEVPLFAMFKGAKANTLEIQMQRAGLLTARIGVLAQGEATATSTAAGTPAEPTFKRFGHFNGAVQRNGTPLGSIVSASITYSNGLEAVETIRADGLIDGVDEGVASMSGTLVVRFDSAALLDQAIDGTASTLDFGWTISATESLLITAHQVLLPRPRREITGPAGIEVTFDWMASKAASPARMCTAVLTNAVEAY